MSLKLLEKLAPMYCSIFLVHTDPKHTIENISVHCTVLESTY